MYFNILVSAPHQKLHLNLDLPAECIKNIFIYIFSHFYRRLNRMHDWFPMPLLYRLSISVSISVYSTIQLCGHTCAASTV